MQAEKTETSAESDCEMDASAECKRRKQRRLQKVTVKWMHLQNASRESKDICRIDTAYGPKNGGRNGRKAGAKSRKTGENSGKRFACGIKYVTI